MNEEAVGVRLEKQKTSEQTENQHYAFMFSRFSLTVLRSREISDFRHRVDDVIARWMCSAVTARQQPTKAIQYTRRLKTPVP